MGGGIIMIGKRLKKLRKEKDISQKELAKILDVVMSNVSMYERDERNPSPEVLIKIANFFNVSVGYLLGTEPEETITNNTKSEYPTKLSGDYLPQELRDAGIEYIELFKHAAKSGLTHEDIKEALEFAEKMKKKANK